MALKNTNTKNRVYFARQNKKSTNVLSNRNFYDEVMCPRCSGKFELRGDLKNNNAYYECKKCRYTLTFLEYQKRYINLNWHKTIDLGFELYSWDEYCPICGSKNPFITYCINQSVGTEDLCLFWPFLLGSVKKLDYFLMKFCDSISLFPNDDGVLIPTIFCNKCDSPFTADFFMDSFLKQKKLDLEYTIKRKIINKYIDLKVEDITNLLSKLKYLDI